MFMRVGSRDPTGRRFDGELWHSWRSPEGPATLRISAVAGGFDVEAWGPGAAAAVAVAGELVGERDDPGQLIPLDPVVAAAVSRNRGFRLPRAPWRVETLLACVLQQRVAFDDAADSWRKLVFSLGEPAPGPVPLWLPPEPRVLARLTAQRWFDWGVDRKRAATMKEVAFQAGKVAALATAGQATALFAHLRGIGPWTEGMFRGIALGDPDAVPIGDLRLPRKISYAFTGVPHGDDDQMLALLAPYVGQRYRVIRVLLG